MTENKKDDIKKQMLQDAENANLHASQKHEIPHVMQWEAAAFPKLKKIWHGIKSSAVYKAFRSSKLNPYHMGVKEIKAESLDKAKKIAREMAKVARAKGKKHRAQFIYNGVRYFADRHDCTMQQEYKEDEIIIRDGYDVTDRIPRNEKGEPDLFAKDFVLIAIIPIEGPPLVGHACMQYHDMVVNRLVPSIHTDPLYPKYGNEHAEYFAVFLDDINVKGKDLYRKMEKHNILHMDDDYNPVTRSCAQNVAKVFKKVGVKDFDFYGPDFLGISYATPGNNPFGVGLKAWCHQHGVRLRPEEVAEYNRRYAFTDVKERREEMREKRARYKRFIGKDKGGR